MMVIAVQAMLAVVWLSRRALPEWIEHPVTAILRIKIKIGPIHQKTSRFAREKGVGLHIY
jgi:hypothetical protein